MTQQTDTETTVLPAKPSKSWRFILSRVNDREFHSKKWIIGYALLFWLVTRILAGGLVAGCAAVYEHFGFTYDEMAKFASSAEQIANSTRPVWYILMMTLLVAPLLEEVLFRLGLSFRKWQIAVSAAMVPGFAI